MREEFLYYVWHYQKYDAIQLLTTSGKSLRILRPGYRNQNSGPDFSQAQIEIDGIRWAGSVEIHVRSTDWLAHKHTTDLAYENVILHVVWEHNKDIYLADNQAIPTLELKGKVPLSLLDRHDSLFANMGAAPACLPVLASVPSIVISQQMEVALMERLRSKTDATKVLLEHTGQDWEETTYRLIARILGLPLNAEGFDLITQQASLRILRKEAAQPHRIEAILLGLAGFLAAESDDPYTILLQKEFQFLRAKYAFQPIHYLWRWGQMRPPNFPAIKLAQLATLVRSFPHFFSILLSAQEPKALLKSLQISADSNWQKRYSLGPEGKTGSPVLGKEKVAMLVTNALVPILIAYAEINSSEAHTQRALALLEVLPMERNHITKQWAHLPTVPQASAYHAQALIGLHKLYCQPLRCLSCKIGANIIG